MVTGRVPDRLRHRLVPLRRRGWAVLALYSAVPLNAIPRLADAPPWMTLVTTALAGLLAAVGCTAAIIATHRAGTPGSVIPEGAGPVR
ncbi:hypothetical protein GCM10010145_33990 [Streptomyces ruber]|uniref:Uncharacterized protein n=3 Tax=Streptomyces TaxID=1883 RepID=A0A918BFB0_9ACTN|nr:hypothetical protein GCM10010145_33990 [Streptomyces ruber]